MPIYNHYYPDSDHQVNTRDSADRLELEGPIVPVTVGQTARQVSLLQAMNLPVPPPVSGMALIDTGASVCMIDSSALDSLQIAPTGSIRIATPSGESRQDTHPAALSFPGTSLPDVDFTNFVNAPIESQGIVAILGRNVLRNWLVIYNGPGGQITIAH